MGVQPGHRPKNSSDGDDLWSSKKTAEMLGQGEGNTREDLQLAKAIKDHPELER